MGSILAKPVEPSCQTEFCLNQKNVSKDLFLSEVLSFPRGTELQTMRNAKNTTVAEHAVSTSEHRVERSGRILSRSWVSPLNSKDTLEPVLDNPTWDPVPSESPTATCPALFSRWSLHLPWGENWQEACVSTWVYLPDCIPQAKEHSRIVLSFQWSASFSFHKNNTQELHSGLPWRLSAEESTCQCRRRRLDLWSGRVPHAEQLSPCTTANESVRPGVRAPRQEKPPQ